MRTNSIVEQTQIWWSIRPHHTFGTVELRICDAQTSAADGDALIGLIVACIAQAALDYDDGVGPRARRRAWSRRTSGARSATGSTAS